jgi:hypothetical protein
MSPARMSARRRQKLIVLCNYPNCKLSAAMFPENGHGRGKSQKNPGRTFGRFGAKPPVFLSLR